MIGKIFILIGFIFIIIGLLIKNFPILNYFGKLPGDIYIKKENFTFIFPITTSILLSLIFSLLIYIISKINK